MKMVRVRVSKRLGMYVGSKVVASHFFIISYLQPMQVDPDENQHLRQSMTTCQATQTEDAMTVVDTQLLSHKTCWGFGSPDALALNHGKGNS